MWSRALAVVFSVLVVAVSVNSAPAPIPTRNPNLGKCSTDDDCVAFPDTVCVIFMAGDAKTGKCTPNSAKKPVCRGAQAGLCPQYQSATQGYINTQCVLIDKAMQSPTGQVAVVPVNQRRSGSGSGSKAKSTVTEPSSTKATPAPKKSAKSAAGSHSRGSSSSSGSISKRMLATNSSSSSASGAKNACPSDPSLALSDPACWFTTVYNDATITVQYQCVDYDMCGTLSAAAQASAKDKEAYCQPQACVTGDHELCNNQGTCQGNSPTNAMRPSSYTCRCYAGFSGSQCENTVDGSCDVDCGLGGACVNQTCACYKGWIGKDARCLKCTSDDACENGNLCDIDTGKCQCASGFTGPTCGGKLDACVGVQCSDGGTCKVSDDGKTGVCYCQQCSEGTCQQCGPKGNCSIPTYCPSLVTSVSGELTLASFFVIVIPLLLM